MFCGHCGAENDDQSRFCASCGNLLAAAGSPEAAGEQRAAYTAPPPGSQPPPPPPATHAGSHYAQAGYDQVQNTSGMGPGYPMPPEASNYNFGGCIPYGIFPFANGNVLWGVLGLLVGITNIYVFFKGNEIAWQSRRFASRQQFIETMNAWNMWGKIVLGIQLGFMLLYFIFVGVMVGIAMQAEGTGGTYSGYP